MGKAVTMLAEHGPLFEQWWGSYVVGLTDEELAAGAASRAAMRATEAAWRASALMLTRRAATGRRKRRDAR